MDDLRDFVRTRREDLKQELSQWPAIVPNEPRKPQYTLTVGKANGTFSTTWSDESTDRSSKVDAQIVIDKKEIEVQEWSARAQILEFPQFGSSRQFRGPQGEEFRPPVNLVFNGVRVSNGERISISFFIDRKLFEQPQQEPIEVSGRLTEGSSGGFGFGGGGKSVRGKLRLAKAGTKSGDEVSGLFEATITETRGGFFNRRRPQPPQPPAILTALDTDRNGELSEAEIANAAKSLQALDRNQDGELAGEELSASQTRR